MTFFPKVLEETCTVINGILCRSTLRVPVIGTRYQYKVTWFLVSILGLHISLFCRNFRHVKTITHVPWGNIQWNVSLYITKMPIVNQRASVICHSQQPQLLVLLQETNCDRPWYWLQNKVIDEFIRTTIKNWNVNRCFNHLSRDYLKKKQLLNGAVKWASWPHFYQTGSA